MKKLLAVLLITFLSCTEKTKSSKISITPAKKKLETQVKENINISGKWIFTEKSENSDIPVLQFTVAIKQDGEDISGQYCAIANNGAKIDCENETRYNLKGKLINGTFTGSFYSFFGSSKDQGKFEISVIDNNTLSWKIFVSPKGEFYAPEQCGLKRDISTVSSTSTTKVFLTQVIKKKNADWLGKYSCNFLRMKDESGDPRGWGMIYIDVKKDASTFKLESYIEQISKELIILNQNDSEIILSLKNQKDSTFIIHKKENQYFLKSNFIDKTIGEKETYLLLKK